MTWLRRFLPTTIRTQMVLLIVVAIIVVVKAGSLLENLEGGEYSDDNDVTVARAETVAALFAQTPPEDHAALLAGARRAGMDIALTDQRDFESLVEAERTGGFLSRMLSLLFSAEYHDMSPGTEIVLHDGSPAIFVPITQQNALLYMPDASTFVVHDFTSRYTYYFISFVTFVALFSVFGIRAITAPLRNLMRELASTKAFLDNDAPLKAQGSREIADLTNVLNELKFRIRAMMAGQTRMLRAVSHDLRTPLTRIRLRSERIENAELRDQIVADVGNVNKLINATLDYIRNDRDTEQPERTDLASMLETIVADYSDLGSDITYDGPPRLIWTVKPNAFQRAIVNLCDNGLKFGTSVTVTLRDTGTGVKIEIRDNGPGVPETSRGRLIEPFFKLDDARSEKNAPSGFGLGLSIVDDIVRDHGGTVSFHDNEPHGLVVALTFTDDTLAPSS
ncbi:HAMP domain-containing sensor histidine kinase [uncultured Martelella sp.]|uniref:sensor histidine kinase n=1 Tax=uncultured Martelella sp. TaxID=392331 RepID=UPI0029C962BD|nr:HAMP domain-containing sensor histidine kinase [uncultured Martelella sp.]